MILTGHRRISDCPYNEWDAVLLVPEHEEEGPVHGPGHGVPCRVRGDLSGGCHCCFSPLCVHLHQDLLQDVWHGQRGGTCCYSTQFCSL